MKRTHFSSLKKSFWLIGIILLYGCTYHTPTVIGCPNPLGIKCRDAGGRYITREYPIWKDQAGICVFPEYECRTRYIDNGICQEPCYGKLIPIYDCSESDNPEVCTEEDIKVLHNIIGTKSLIIESEADYKDIDWNTGGHNTGWWFFWCCKHVWKCQVE